MLGQNQIRLIVYRRLDNRLEGLPDDSPQALELHNRRRATLHEVLDGNPGWIVPHWGKTDDTVPHEWVELVVEFVRQIAENPAVPA